MKKLFNRILESISVATAIVFNRYEGATPMWGTRTWLPAAIQDARFDADGATRLELLRRSRYWEQNSGIMQRLVDLFEQFTVGSNGLQCVPDSSSEPYNESASDWFSKWSQYPDLVSKQSFPILQTLMARSWFVDGEIFILKTYSAETNRPRVQLIEGHRVGTPPDRSGDEGKSIIDGVQVNAVGRPVGYWIKQTEAQDSYKLVPAVQVIHLFEPVRPGMMRGLPFCYAVMNDLHDLEDLQMLEMRAAKQASDITNVLTNETGEANPADMRRNAMKIQTANADAQTVEKSDAQYYQTTLGGRTVVLKKGQTFEQFQSTRPSVAQREYWDYVVAKICAGVGISRLLVFPYSMQGTVTRADLDVSSVFFRSRSAVIATAVREIYEWVMTWANQYDRQLDGKPTDGTALNAVIRPPRTVNVDVGRNSSAAIAELEAGGRTYQDWYAEYGEDWRKQLRQKTQERAYIHKLAKEFSTPDYQISVDEIASLAQPVDKPEEADPASGTAAKAKAAITA